MAASFVYIGAHWFELQYTKGISVRHEQEFHVNLGLISTDIFIYM